MRRGAAVILLAVACGGSQKPAPTRAPRTFSTVEIARRTAPSVVTIRTDRALGTGFVIAKGGLVATNFHVLRGARRVTVQTADERVFDQVTVVGFDAARDLAVLRIRQLRLAPLRLSTRDPEIGEHVIAIGNPVGLERTVSDGVVSAMRHVGMAHDLIQISAPISHGSSGGPVLDDRGRVIGVATAMRTSGQNLNFATPAGYLTPIAEENGDAPISSLPDDQARRYFKGCSAAELVTIHLAVGRALSAADRQMRKGQHRDALDDLLVASADLILRVPRCRWPRHDLLRAAARAERAGSPQAAAQEVARMMKGIAAELAAALR
jgi:S1-C subfamily serine protease